MLLYLSVVLSECSTDEFRCRNGECIDIGRVCDFHADCLDASDEWQTNCGKLHCLHLSLCVQLPVLTTGRFGKFHKVNPLMHKVAKR